MRCSAILLSILAAAPAFGDALVAARTIRAREVISSADLAVSGSAPDGAVSDIALAVGQEARVTLYEGQPVFASDLVPAAVVERNDLVEISYRNGPLMIRTDGRALGRGAVGDRLRVMNLASRNTVTGTVSAPGLVSVP